MKEYVIPKDTITTVNEVWNVYTKKTGPQIDVRKNSGRKKEGAVRQKIFFQEGTKEKLKKHPNIIMRKKI